MGSMVYFRVLVKAVKLGVMSYFLGGIGYWMTAEVFLRYMGKDITFSPLVSALLTVPFWPMHVYGDLKWIGILPQDFVSLLVFSSSILLLPRVWTR